MKSFLFTVLCLLFASLAGARVIEAVYDYSDTSCTSEIAAVYIALNATETCSATTQCLSATNGSATTKCLSSIPSQPANSIRVGIYTNENCDFSKQDGSVITETVLGKAGCLKGSYFTCSGGSYLTYTCDDAQCNVNCKPDPEGPTTDVGKCQSLFGIGFKATCTGSSGSSSASALSLSSFFILAVLIVTFAF